MFLIDDILMSPVTMTVWLARKVKEQAERQLYDVEALKAGLEVLREMHEAGELSDEEFMKKEERLLKTLQEAMAYRKDRPE